MAELSITSGGHDRVPQAIALYAPVFLTDPVLTYLLSPMTPNERAIYLPKYFHSLLTAAALNRASFDEIDGWKSGGTLIPPGARVDNPLTLIQSGFFSVLWKLGISGCRKMLSEYTPLADAAKAKIIKNGERYYYVFFLGTKKEEQGNGLCTGLVKHYQGIAAKEGVSIWLEATTKHSMELYKRTGFEVVGEFVLGRGTANADGTSSKGGPGVVVWTMIWRAPISD